MLLLLKPKYQEVRKCLICYNSRLVNKTFILIQLFYSSVVERSEDPVYNTPYPASIFNGDYMRHVNKALLGHAIIDRKKKNK